MLTRLQSSDNDKKITYADIKIIFFLVILVGFPSNNFFLRYSFEFVSVILLCKWFDFRKVITIKYLTYFLFFFTLIVIHTFMYPSFSESEDIVRVLIFLLFLAFLSNKISFKIIDYTFLILIILNIILIQYFESGDSFGLSKLLHVRSLEESYGRHSGLFSNVAVLGLFSLCIIVYNVATIFYSGDKKYLRIIMILSSIYLLFESGSKTSILAALICTNFIFLDGLRYKKKAGFIIIFIVLSMTIYSISPYTTFANYRELNTLFFILKGNSQAALTVFARIDIWENIIKLNFSNISFLLFGVPKAILDSVTTTYDNDYIWFFGRFGLLGFFVYLFLQLSFLRKIFISRKKRQSHLIIFWVFLSILISGFGLGVVTTPQVLTISLILMSPVINEKINIYDN